MFLLLQKTEVGVRKPTDGVWFSESTWRGRHAVACVSVQTAKLVFFPRALNSTANYFIYITQIVAHTHTHAKAALHPLLEALTDKP